MVDYWLDLFTAETWEEARQYGFQVTGFRASKWSAVERIKLGDLLVCYLTKLSRFCGILKVRSQPYKDIDKAKKIWKHDSFPCLLDVDPIITLDLLHSVPKDEIIPRLSSPMQWKGLVRGSPTRISFDDGEKSRKL